MQPLYTEQEFKAAKSRQLLLFRCIHCSKTFHRSKTDVRKSFLPHRQERHKFCSPHCQRHHETPTIYVQCIQCQKSFKKLPSQIKRSKHHFCCRSCSTTWRNLHKKHGTRISKLEIWLAKQLPKLYPDLEFHFNRKDTINSELDIYIPSLKLAFELNGIFHYEPIYGPEKLASTQNNDSRKAQACLEQCIELCLIDVSHQKYFKEQSSMKFLAIIRNIIDLKLSRS